MYTILDIESTGGKYNEEGITEIAIHKFDGHKVVDKFISLVNPEKEIQPFVVKLTGINNKMLRTAPKFHEVAKRIIEITEGCVLIAHNAQFDYRILRTEYNRLGYNFERKTLCTIELSQKLLPDLESYSLGKLVRSLGIPVTDRHRANGDALATLKLFKLLLSKDLDKTIIKSVVKAETLGELSPTQLSIIDQLPTETGVFYFHNKDGDIIFMGSSTNLKKVVNQLFIKRGDRARKLQKETKKVTFEKTGNELVALLKLNAELKHNKPKYNTSQKKIAPSHAVYRAVNKEGYITLKSSIANGSKNKVTDFESIQTANSFLHKINLEFKLCDKLNGLSEVKQNCSKFNDGNCDGACIGKEAVIDYNQRVKDSISKYSLTTKNIIISDKGREIGEYSVILIKNGVFKGLGYYDLNHQLNNIHILESIITPMKSTANSIFIIESHLRKNTKMKIIELKD